MSNVTVNSSLLTMQPSVSDSTPSVHLDSSSSAVQVAVRVRPLNAREIAGGARNICTMSGKNEANIPNTTNRNEKQLIHPYASNIASQEDIFNDLGNYILENAFEGYNCSMFAYGQTGSGKTYTMFGEDIEKKNGQRQSNKIGLIPRICRALFERDKTRYISAQDIPTNISDDETLNFVSIEISYLEIYNERIRDLFSPQEQENQTISPKNKNIKKKSLRIREHPRTGVYVEGLRTMYVLYEFRI
eukprot:GSMAST32.ASY1.ANO1.853.1 assembled CDS